MTKATENDLGALHALVAKALKAKVISPLFVEGEAVAGTEGLGASASDLAAAITFLKNNNITADPDQNSDLAELKTALEARRKNSKLSLLANQDAAADFAKFIHAPGTAQ